MPIVSNSSPLIALAQIQRLDFVPAILQSVLMPPAVAREIEPSIPVLPAWIAGSFCEFVKVGKRCIEVLPDMHTAGVVAVCQAMCHRMQFGNRTPVLGDDEHLTLGDEIEHLGGGL